MRVYVCAGTNDARHGRAVNPPHSMHTFIYIIVGTIRVLLIFCAPYTFALVPVKTNKQYISKIYTNISWIHLTRKPSIVTMVATLILVILHGYILTIIRVVGMANISSTLVITNKSMNYG